MGSLFPVKLLEFGSDHYFCPGRVFRDDPEFAHSMRTKWLGWKLHQVPSGATIDTITPDDSDIISTMIFRWEELERVRDFHTLGKMLGGSKEGK